MWRLWLLFTMAPWHFLNKIFDCLQTTKTVKLNGGTFGRALVEGDPRLKTHCQEFWPKLAGAAGCKANSESVKFTNKRLDFCQIWLGEYKGPVHLSFIILDSWFCSYAHIL